MPTPLRASPLPGPRPAPPPPQFTPGRRGTRHHRSRSQPVYSEPFVVRLTRPLAVGTCHGGRSRTPRARWGRRPGCGRGGGSGAGGQGQSQGHTAGPSPVQWPSLSHTAGLGSRSLSFQLWRNAQSTRSAVSKRAIRGQQVHSHCRATTPISLHTRIPPKGGRPSVGASGITCTRLHGIPVLDTTTRHVAFRDRLFSRRFQGPCTSW